MPMEPFLTNRGHTKCFSFILWVDSFENIYPFSENVPHNQVPVTCFGDQPDDTYLRVYSFSLLLCFVVLSLTRAAQDQFPSRLLAHKPWSQVVFGVSKTKTMAKFCSSFKTLLRYNYFQIFVPCLPPHLFIFTDVSPHHYLFQHTLC